MKRWWRGLISLQGAARPSKAGLAFEKSERGAFSTCALFTLTRVWSDTTRTIALGAVTEFQVARGSAESAIRSFPSKASRTRRASKLDQCAPINALSTKLQCKRHVLDNVGSRVSDLPGWKAKANGSGVYSRSMVMREVARMAWVAVYTSICTVGVTGLEVAATAKTIRTRVDVSSATSSGCQAMV